MSVSGLALDASNKTPIILLRDPSGRRQVPIWIDHAQAHNIMAGIQSPIPSRPQTHDLMISLLNAGGLSLDRVIIHTIEEGAFQAVLKIRIVQEIKKEQKEASTDHHSFIEIDARPSDAIALAVRTNCSIWMFEEVVSKASIPVDANADEEDQVQFRQFVEDLSPAALVRHLKNRDPKNNSPETPDSDTPT